jgi:hypothetical protein
VEFVYYLIHNIGDGVQWEDREAAVAAHAGEVWLGDILVMMSPANAPSANVARKIGSEYWKQADFDGFMVDLYRLIVAN